MYSESLLPCFHNMSIYNQGKKLVKEKNIDTSSTVAFLKYFDDMSIKKCGHKKIAKNTLSYFNRDKSLKSKTILYEPVPSRLSNQRQMSKSHPNRQMTTRLYNDGRQS